MNLIFLFKAPVDKKEYICTCAGGANYIPGKTKARGNFKHSVFGLLS